MLCSALFCASSAVFCPALPCPALLPLVLKSCMLCANTWLHVCLTCVCFICWQHACTAGVQTCLSSKLHSQTGLSSCSKCIVRWEAQTEANVYNVFLQHTNFQHPCWMLLSSNRLSVHLIIHSSVRPSVRPSIHPSIRLFAHSLCSCVLSFIDQAVKFVGANYNRLTKRLRQSHLKHLHDKL